MINIQPEESIHPAHTKGNLSAPLKAIHNSPNTAPEGECMHGGGEGIPQAKLLPPPNTFPQSL